MKPKSSIPSIANIHHDSHHIAKLKPKVKIVHIFAPEIIKTDVENFRELVQRLTGKPLKVDVGVNKGRRQVSINEEVVMMRCKHTEGVQVKRKLEEEENEGCLDGMGDVEGLFQGLGDLPIATFGFFK